MAFIIFDNSERRITLEHLLTYLRDECGLPASLGEWQFFDQVVPQVECGTTPPVAFQLNERPDSVPEEITELLDHAGEALDEPSRVRARRCRSRIDVVSCQSTRIDRFAEGGILTSTPEVDLDEPKVQSVLRRVTTLVNGWCYDNVNGGWIGVA
jgi:hypothetical protein